VIIQDDQFAGLCRALARDELTADARFRHMAGRFRHYGEHGDEVLREFGFDTAAIAALRTSNCTR